MKEPMNNPNTEQQVEQALATLHELFPGVIIITVDEDKTGGVYSTGIEEESIPAILYQLSNVEPDKYHTKELPS